nr:DNA repair protein RAD51 homolog 2 [Ipomoea batatas]
MAGRIIVLRPTSLSEFTERLQQIRDSLFQHNVKLLIVDSLAALLSGESSQGPHRQHSLGWHISFLKSLAEFSRIPVVVTNQVRSQNRDEISQYFFQVQRITDNLDNPTKFDHHLIAALGIHWSHAVTNRLVFESRSGQRFMKLAKSSISPPIAFPFDITSSGISLLDDDGEEITGPEINTINYQGLILILFMSY